MKRTGMPQALLSEQDYSQLDVEWDLIPQARERWCPNLIAAVTADKESNNTISMLDPIGESFFTEGVTAKRVSAALRSIGAEKDVVVHLNSPGGNFFEGMTIYNLLREHKGNVTVKVLGIAASIASVIAMAGDEVQISRSGFLMVHNSHVGAIGNRHDLRDVADMLEPFDAAMTDIYMARTGLDAKVVGKKMDAETFINGSAAVDEGWADSLLPSDAVSEEKISAHKVTAQLMDMALAKAGMSRTERRSFMQDYRASMLNAAGRNGMPRATEEDGKLRAAEVEVFEALKSFSIT